MATPKTRPGSPVDDEAWVTVERKRPRRKEQLQQREVRGASEHRGPIPVWRLVSHHEANYFLAIRWLGEELALRLGVTISLTEEAFLRGADWASAGLLEEVALGQPHGIVLERKEPSTKGILVGYPAHWPLDPVLEHRSVAEAERCTYNAGHGRCPPHSSDTADAAGSSPCRAGPRRVGKVRRSTLRSRAGKVLPVPGIRAPPTTV